MIHSLFGGAGLVAGLHDIPAIPAGGEDPGCGEQVGAAVAGRVNGYLMVAQDGGVFDFSGIVGGFLGSLANSAPTRPIVAVATLG